MLQGWFRKSLASRFCRLDVELEGENKISSGLKHSRLCTLCWLCFLRQPRWMMCLLHGNRRRDRERERETPGSPYHTSLQCSFSYVLHADAQERETEREGEKEGGREGRQDIRRAPALASPLKWNTLMG